jgi:hypothetical protein
MMNQMNRMMNSMFGGSGFGGGMGMGMLDSPFGMPGMAQQQQQQVHGGRGGGEMRPFGGMGLMSPFGHMGMGGFPNFVSFAIYWKKVVSTFGDSYVWYWRSVHVSS